MPQSLWPARTLVAFVGVSACPTCILAVEPPAQVFVVWPTGRASADGGRAAAIAQASPTLLDHCSLDSATDPAVFAGRGPSADWETVRKEPHVRVAWTRPVFVERRRGRVEVVEAVIPLDVAAPYWFARSRKAVVLWTKCRWPDVKAILCAPPVVEHLTSEGRRQCDTHQ